MTTFDRGASELERAAFVARASSLGLENVGPFHWYHVIDLGDALVTPGQFDYRESLDSFGFDTDYTGRTVLDVGSATGFFAFEFERRGASVTSLEIASLDQIDRFPGQTPESVIRRILHVLYGHDPERLARETSESLYRNLLTGPFDLCRQRLASKVDRAYLPVYDLSLERLGIKSGFDLVFVSDILWHTINPLQALAAAASVCADRIMIVQPMPSIPGSVPALVFDANDTFGADEVHWFAPTAEFFIRVLRKLGFAEAAIIGTHRVARRHSNMFLDRIIVHGRRTVGDGAALRSPEEAR